MNINFDSKPLFLAPMAGLSHRPLRTLISEFKGCDYYMTEMASAAAIISGAPFEKYYLDAMPSPMQTIIQLVGHDVKDFVKAAIMLNEKEIVGVDVNMGCSAPEIVSKECGVFWMLDKDKAAHLVSSMRKVLSNKTLSVKMRTGWNDDPQYLVQFAKAIEEAGADFITLHPRLKNQKLKRTPTYEYISLLKQNLKIPVIANGDICDFNQVKKLETLGADGMMIGRCAIEKPWIFKLIKDHDLIHDGIEIHLEEIASRFIDLIVEFQPPEFYESRLRRFFFYFTKTFTFSHDTKWKIQNASTPLEIRSIIKSYFESVPSDRIKMMK